jgi:hypothetical protein
VTFEEYNHHVDWSLTVGWRRTRQTIRLVDDQPRMTRSLPSGKAVADIVNAVDRGHREVVTTNRARRRAVAGPYSR